jgi:hypothetical protein
MLLLSLALQSLMFINIELDLHILAPQNLQIQVALQMELHRQGMSLLILFLLQFTMHFIDQAS